jgi:hypothetical protein
MKDQIYGDLTRRRSSKNQSSKRVVQDGASFLGNPSSTGAVSPVFGHHLTPMTAKLTEEIGVYVNRAREAGSSARRRGREHSGKRPLDDDAQYGLVIGEQHDQIGVVLRRHQVREGCGLDAHAGERRDWNRQRFV